MYPWVNKYIGIPFVSGGRDNTGCDCYGLIRLILSQEYNIGLPEFVGDYTNALDVTQTKKLFCDMIPVLTGEKIDYPEEASVALIRSHGCLCHVALYAGEDYIIHCRRDIGAVCERLSSPRITGTVEGWYRIDPSYSTFKSVLSRENSI